MKNWIKTLLVFLLISTSFQSQAAIGLVSAIFSPVSGVKIALTGLGLIEIGRLQNAAGGDWNGFGTFVFGTLLLDGDAVEMQLQPIDEDRLQQMGLTFDEIQEYNNSTEELTALLDDVSHRANNSEEAKLMWSEYEELVGRDALNGMRKVLENGLK